MFFNEILNFPKSFKKAKYIFFEQYFVKFLRINAQSNIAISLKAMKPDSPSSVGSFTGTITLV